MKRRSVKRKLVTRKKRTTKGGYICTSPNKCFLQDTQYDDEVLRKSNLIQASTNINQAAYLANTNSFLNQLN